VTWALMHNGDVHATAAGVATGLILRTIRDEGEDAWPGERTEPLLRPLSAGVAVSLFALFAAGVSVSAAAVGEAGTGQPTRHPLREPSGRDGPCGRHGAAAPRRHPHFS
jgi:Na+/H+ antiporter NhaA